MIETERLRLVPLTRAQLALYRTNPAHLEIELGLRLSRAVLTEATQRAISKKLARMARAPADAHLWHTFWLAVISAEALGAGLLGFKGPPDGRGEVEIGYGIDPAFEGLGYTTEAARGLIGWAFSHPECRAVVAPETPRRNAASNRVLAKLGMRVYAESAATRSWRVDRAAVE